ncbi:MAG: Na+/H+ antiporter NhaA [Enterovibrio sp.]
MTGLIRQFIKMESASGIILIVAALIAMGIANSGLQELYHGTLHAYVAGLSVSHWINDALMAIFFLLIGLEVKRELIEGALNSKEKAIFPAIAAVGGMLAPALIYFLFNKADPSLVHGWAIPAATDIAFALGVLALLGKRVPIALKVFLLALAIIDDLGVIVIIALFYSSDMSFVALGGAAAAILGLVFINMKGVVAIRWYLLLGLILWFCVLKSGVHATLAGVILGFCVPLNSSKAQAGAQDEHSPLKKMEHFIHPYSSFFILPLFAFANAGISLDGISWSSLGNSVTLGVAAGLLFGKPLGIFTFSWLSVKAGFAKLPDGITFRHIFAVSVLCGIGFTMSIFISSLAFVNADQALVTYSKLGILLGSTTAAVLGYSILNIALPKTPAAPVAEEKVIEAAEDKQDY